MTTASAVLPSRRPRWRRPRVAGILAAALVIAIGSYAWAALRPTPVPQAPPTTVTTDATSAPVIEAPAVGGNGAAPIGGGRTDASAGSDGSAYAAPGSIAAIDHSIAAWTANLAANPHDYLSATNLAILYHGRGRLTADLGDQEKALQAAKTALAIVPDDVTSRELEATIQYTLHDFAGSFAIVDAIYVADTTQLAALATRLDDEIELGRIADARVDLAVLGKGTSGAAVDIRAARLASVTGDAAGALRFAKAALASAATDDETDLGFYDYAVGEYARLAGDGAAARKAYTDALAVRSTDIASLVGLARIDAAGGHTAAAIAGLQKAAAIAPQPETLGLFGDLQAATGDTSGAAAQFKTVQFIEQLGQIESTVFDRVLLRFELDHGGANAALLDQARASVAARPDYTGYDALAWTLHRLGRDDEAAAQMTLARSNGAADARLFYHSGGIELARGDATTGKTLLRQALALGAALDPVERAEATRLLGS